jgi:hypothetical protein
MVSWKNCHFIAQFFDFVIILGLITMYQDYLSLPSSCLQCWARRNTKLPSQALSQTNWLMIPFGDGPSTSNVRLGHPSKYYSSWNGFNFGVLCGKKHFICFLTKKSHFKFNNFCHFSLKIVKPWMCTPPCEEVLTFPRQKWNKGPHNLGGLLHDHIQTNKHMS